MPWPGKSTKKKTKAEKEHSKQVAVFVAEKAPDYHEYFGMAPVDYNAESDKLEPLPADKYDQPFSSEEEDPAIDTRTAET
jgi:hypothetical protein